MDLVLKRGATKEEIEALEKRLYSEKTHAGFNAQKYNGVLKLEEDPLTIQRILRDEWERNLS